MAGIFSVLTVTICLIWSKNIVSFVMNKTEACNNLSCDSSDVAVCGIRNEPTKVRLKIFANECALLKYGCSVDNENAYGLIRMEHCRRSGIINTGIETQGNESFMGNLEITRNFENINSECDVNCDNLYQDIVCGIRQDGAGYKIRLFENSCELAKYNCNSRLPFIRTDMFICEGKSEALDTYRSKTENDEGLETKYKPSKKFKGIVVVDGSMLGRITDVNDTIENFFAATHVLDLPLRQIDEREFKTRRKLLKYVGPTMVFQPWITIPKKIKTDYHHKPTLSTCYHKCPTQCPDTYSPVCGVPGILAREPSIMFQNHCYMDVAQCKMFWENKSSTAASSSYIESSFLFCLGDQLNGMYRFLPLIKTLQHMGRLKKKGNFRYRIKNIRFFNNYAYKEPKLMG